MKFSSSNSRPKTLVGGNEPSTPVPLPIGLAAKQRPGRCGITQMDGDRPSPNRLDFSITDMQQLTIYLETRTQVGESIDAKILRNGEGIMIRITLEERPPQ